MGGPKKKKKKKEMGNKLGKKNKISSSSGKSEDPLRIQLWTICTSSLSFSDKALHLKKSGFYHNKVYSFREIKNNHK